MAKINQLIKNSLVYHLQMLAVNGLCAKEVHVYEKAYSEIQ